MVVFQKKNLINFSKTCVISACLIFILGCNQKHCEGDNNFQNYFDQHLLLSNRALDSLNKYVADSTLAWQYYKQARRTFKKVEPIVAFNDRANYKTLMAPNLLKVEEEDATDIKIKNPIGFQVIEESIDDNTITMEEKRAVITDTKNRIQLVRSTNKIDLKKHHILWLIRDQIIRIATTGITGFDSPVLEASIQEAANSYRTLDTILTMVKDSFDSPAIRSEWREAIALSKQALQGQFGSFNRYHFIKNHTEKQLQLWHKTSEDWKVQFPFELAINNGTTSLFDKNTFNEAFFIGTIVGKEKNPGQEKLGKQLFNDTNLSTDRTMSCATCHQESKAFTDGLAIFPKQKRNTPALPYSSLQQAFFYDARSGSLEGQIVSVVNNKDEFHSNLDSLVSRVQSNPDYVKAFQDTYESLPTDMNIRQAIATYIRSLNDFDSKFDRNISGQENSLNDAEINGFNLFMGSAKCATCHFPPVFNGTIPPNYTDTEMENLGVTMTEDFQNPILDKDLGRYHFFNTEERKFFFKTPTVRNSALTAPYMHHGAYTSLEKVMEFYNEGGGIGLGVDVPLQTLPPDKLNLSEADIKDIIAFLHTLTDQRFLSINNE